jgi:hypothetical protein
MWGLLLGVALAGEPETRADAQPIEVLDWFAERQDLERGRQRSSVLRAVGAAAAGVGVAAIVGMASDPTAADQSEGLIAALVLIGGGVPLGLAENARHRHTMGDIAAMELTQAARLPGGEVVPAARLVGLPNYRDVLRLSGRVNDEALAVAVEGALAE